MIAAVPVHSRSAARVEDPSRGVDRSRTLTDVSRGGMSEWFKEAVLKTAVRETVPGVRIPLPPPNSRFARIERRERPSGVARLVRECSIANDGGRATIALTCTSVARSV